MEELIKSSFLSYAFSAAFVGWCFFSIIHSIFKNAKNVENTKLKTVLRVGISSVLVCLWAWWFVYMELYPISLAYYEYNHDFAEEKIGVIDTIEQKGKDRICLIIDNTEYTMAYSSIHSDVIIDSNIGKGDTVKYKFGVKSKYIFEIYELNTSP